MKGGGKMELVIIIILVCILVIGSVIFLLYLKQIHSLKEQIMFITKQDTNLVLFTDVVPVASIQELTDAMNNLVIKHRKLEIELHRANSGFKETITNVSHDLRTPLTSANGYLQMLENTKLEEEKRHEYITIVQNRIQAVNQMLDQLFEYARIESGELVLEEETLVVNHILEEVICDFYDDFKKEQREAIVTIPPYECWILGDRNALKRIFQNLMKNALVHGIGNLKVSLQQEKDKVSICFCNATDTIEEQDIEKIFERFYTTDKSRTKKTTGLGLSIAKKFVLQMKGSIQAKLENNEFCIHMEIPRYEKDN